MSMSSHTPPPYDMIVRHNVLGSVSAGALGPSSVKKPPIVYPALLSRVANAFVQRITTSPRIKDSIEYKDCFDGRDAVVNLDSGVERTPNKKALHPIAKYFNLLLFLFNGL